MKKQLIVLIGIIIFMNIGTCAWCSSSKKEVVRYTIKDTRGVRTGSYRETYQGGTVRKVETYDTRGVRTGVVRGGK